VASLGSALYFPSLWANMQASDTWWDQCPFTPTTHESAVSLGKRYPSMHYPP